MGLASEIKEYAVDIGIDAIGVTKAEPVPQLKKFLQQMKDKNYLSKFVSRDFDLITDPTKTVKKAKSVIVCALSYQVKEEYIQPNSKKSRGKLSRFAWGKDYHQVLGAKLEKIADFLRQKQSGTVARCFVDTGPLVDRELARRAGIGWQGKNCSIIHPEYGSWIFLGEIVTNLELKSDQPLEDKCGDCTKCLSACPMEALAAPYQLDSNRCLGYLTLSRGYLDRDVRTKFGRRLWGCDTCQEVCPHNEQAKVADHPQFRPQKLAAYPKLAPLVNLSEVDYEKKFSLTPMNWRGQRPIQRNAAVVLGNLGEEAGVPPLVKGLQDTKPIVRAHSAWALGQINTQKARKALLARLETERNEKVETEIMLALGWGS